jgi:hypothetical protein
VNDLEDADEDADYAGDIEEVVEDVEWEDIKEDADAVKYG